MSTELFQHLLYIALALGAAGTLWRISDWLRVRIGSDARSVTTATRLAVAIRGTAAVIVSRRLIDIVRALILDVLLQARLYASDKLRWIAHLLLVIGFMLLLLMHALAPLLTVRFFPAYQPTLDPYLFLRNLAGAMVLIGVALMLVGRARGRRGLPRARRPQDAAFMVLLTTVLASGFLLEADKIASPRAFYRMAGQYAGSADPAALEPLRRLWASEFGVAFEDLQPLVEDARARGREQHDKSCSFCHARPASAFVSYRMAQLVAPAMSVLDALGADKHLRTLHLGACLLALATLPFTLFFHVFASPVSLLANAAARHHGLSAAARVSRRGLAYDACVRCGLCDSTCSVATLARHLGNPQLLPAHKLNSTRALASGHLLRASGVEGDVVPESALRAADGAFLCTDCGRCTRQCPVGIDLADLWPAARQEFARAELAAPAQWLQARPAYAWAQSLELAPGAQDAFAAGYRSAPLSGDRAAFARCVQCQTCTNVCPVVARGAAYGIDVTPQQVMNLLRLGLRDLTLGTRMVWDCATCYQCQEHCPEGVRVADIMYELRSLAVERLAPIRGRMEPT